MNFLKELIEFFLSPSNHLIGIGPKLDGNTLHIKASSWEWIAIFCLNWLTCSTGFFRPLYMANVGWWNRLRSFAFSIPRVKGDLEIWLNAFFIMSVPTPLWEGLLRFLRWRCSSLQEKDSLGGVLDLCLYIVSSSSWEETLELEGDRFYCARRSCFLKSSISRCMALSSSCSWDTWPFLWKPLPPVWMVCTLPYCQAQGNHPVDEHLQTLPDVDLILLYCPLYFTNTQVLPTDVANCRVTIWSPSPKGTRSWPSEPSTINL